MSKISLSELSGSYAKTWVEAFNEIPHEPLSALGEALLRAWTDKRQVFVFGNGGSAANALGIVNDWIYPVSKTFADGLRAHALPANTSTITCMANDEGYENIFVYQLAVMAQPGDIVLALSGSGNSPNVLRALEYAREQGLESYAILGFDGGKAKALADHAIHIPVHDMQVVEDLQLSIGHILMLWLKQAR